MELEGNLISRKHLRFVLCLSLLLNSLFSVTGFCNEGCREAMRKGGANALQAAKGGPLFSFADHFSNKRVDNEVEDFSFTEDLISLGEDMNTIGDELIEVGKALQDEINNPTGQK